MLYYFQVYSKVNQFSLIQKAPCGSVGKESASKAVSIPGSGRSLEKGMATHSSVCAWGSPRTQDPYYGVTTVRHNLVIKVKKVLVVQSCLTLCNLMNCSPPGSSVHEIVQARILEWVAMPFSRSD